MTQSSVREIIKALNDAGVRYLVVGGLAVNAHGYVRFTADVDLILALEESNLTKALAVLKALDYRPRAPVPIEEFAISAKRKEWQEAKGLKAFALFSALHPRTEIDLFIDDPLGFDEAAARAVWFSLGENLKMPVCSLLDLVKLKKAADRGKDRVDLEYLKKLYPDQI